MLKSTAPIQEEEEDPLAYYEKHTSQIEARPVCCWVASTHTADESHVCSGCLVPGYSAAGAFPSLCLLKADGCFVLQRELEAIAEPVGCWGSTGCPQTLPFSPRSSWDAVGAAPSLLVGVVHVLSVFLPAQPLKDAFAGWNCSVRRVAGDIWIWGGTAGARK